MNATEFALLFAIATPVLAIVSLNAFLVAAGERGTGLLPSTPEFVVEPTVPVAFVETTGAAPAEAPANDEFVRAAA